MTDDEFEIGMRLELSMKPTLANVVFFAVGVVQGLADAEAAGVPGNNSTARQMADTRAQITATCLLEEIERRTVDRRTQQANTQEDSDGGTPGCAA